MLPQVHCTYGTCISITQLFATEELTKHSNHSKSLTLLRLYPLPKSGPPDTNRLAYLEIYNARKKVA